MKILIYGINYAPELIGIGKYTGEMGAWLAEKGHEVHVVTTPPYYPDWKVNSKYSKWFYNIKVNLNLIIFRCPIFVPSSPKSLLRILHLISFSLTSIPILMAHIFWRPDIVFLVVPTLFCSPGALLLAKLTRAKSVLHIQDFEVDALFGLGLYPDSPRLKRIALYFESLFLKNFNIVSTISAGMLKRALEKGVAPEKLLFFPNWAEIGRFNNAEPSQQLMNELGVFGIKNIILYSGNMGEKQGLENVLFAAQKLIPEENLLFLLVGEGVNKNYLKNIATDLKLPNVIFCPLQSYENFPRLLASVHVHLVIQMRGASDAVLPSKLTNILAVGGNSVITADENTSLGRLPYDHPGVAIIVEPESIDALVLGIKKALNMPRPNIVAQDYAKEYLDKEKLLSTFFKQLEG